MRRTFLYLSLFSVIALAVVGLYRFSVEDVSNNVVPTKSDSSIRSTIDDFWRYSLSGDVESLHRIVTTIPDDYYDKSNKCNKESGEFDRRMVRQTPDGVGSGQGGLGLAQGVTEEQRKFALGDIYRLAEKVEKKNLSSYEIVDVTHSGTDAILTVDYGENESRLYRNRLLLKKLENDWYIFAVELKWHLDIDNPYFAKGNCSK